MKQCRVSAFARAARFIALAAVALGLGASSLLAQGSTGKIEGRVRDQAGAPIANAQVFIVGTAFNALTNPQGYYFINNVPAGTVAVRAAFIGYKSTQVDGVKVLAGQTGTVDIQLEQTAGRDRGDHRRHPDPAAGAARRGDHQAADRRRRSPRICRSTGSTRCWRCSRASWPAPRQQRGGGLSIRGGRTDESGHLRRRRAGDSRATAATTGCGSAGTEIIDRHQRASKRRR